jgi:hypothetical protein
LSLDGGTIQDAAGNSASLTLPATGSDGLATQDIAVGPLSDGFETGDFSAYPWQLSSYGTAANWAVQNTNVYDGTYAAQSGAIGAGSSSTLSLTVDEQAGELSFWRSTTSASGSGSLIFEIDGVPQLQLSSTMPWQQSFFWVSAGQHTFTWIYGKNAGDPSGADYADLDDVEFTPGTTLTVDGTSGSDVFVFDASGSNVVVALDGEVHAFAPGDFTDYVFNGGGGSDTAKLYDSASANDLYTDAAIASLYGADFGAQVDGFGVVNAYGQSGVVNKHASGPDPLVHQLNLFGTW